jgi:heme/copper-type cytochrome/quinol oxidase subunit 2
MDGQIVMLIAQYSMTQIIYFYTTLAAPADKAAQVARDVLSARRMSLFETLLNSTLFIFVVIVVPVFVITLVGIRIGRRS